MYLQAQAARRVRLRLGCVPYPISTHPRLPRVYSTLCPGVPADRLDDDQDRLSPFLLVN